MMSLDEALEGKEIPDEIRKNLTLISVPFFLSMEKSVKDN